MKKSMNNANFINDVRSRFGIENNAELERYLGLSNGYLSKFENGKINDPTKLLYVLSTKGFKFNYKIAKGSPIFISVIPDEEIDEDNPILDEAPKRAFPDRDLLIKAHKGAYNGIPLVFEGAEGLEDGIVIPLLENAASAGYGSGVDDDDTPVRYIQVPHHLSKYPHLAGLPVKGDSMEPTLHDGDLVVCDGGGWDGDGIYVLKTHDTSYVKRVQMTSQGYEVISDNRMYKSITESAESLSIVGKVRAILVIVPGRRGGV